MSRPGGDSGWFPNESKQSSMNDVCIASHRQETLAGGDRGWPEEVHQIMLCASVIRP